MVVDTSYYDTLGVKPDATDIEIKKAYRRAAITHHPDKNPDDPTANEKFQAVGEAYQILSDKQLRAAYDEFGKESARPSEGFADPAEFFTSIFGGDAFVDWIGEISIIKDLTAAIDITMHEMQEQEGQEGEGDGEFPGTEEAMRESKKDAEKDGEKNGEKGGEKPTSSDASRPSPSVVVEEAAEKEQAAAAGAAPRPSADKAPSPGGKSSPSPSPSGTSTPKPTSIPLRPALMDRPSDQVTAQQTDDDIVDPKDKRDKRGLTKEQREQLAALRAEQEKARKERVDKLTEKLLDRISVWTETDKGGDVTEAFRSKMRLEVEELKMESFGIDICHAIGQVYLNKGSTLLRSQKFFGIGGFFSRIRDKGTMIKDTWNTISSAMEAQAEMERMAKQEEEAGEEWTDERQEEAQRRVTGKILGAAWKGSKFEIQDVLRSVCDNVLNDKKAPLSKRLERAQALVLVGDIFSKAVRSPDEEGDYLMFEKLVAEAAVKDKEKDKKKSKDKRKSGVVDDAPNVPKPEH